MRLRCAFMLVILCLAPSFTATAAVPVWTGESNQVDAELGGGAPAGDVNGDGFGDIIVSAPLYDGPYQDGGRAWVYFGSPSGLSPTAGWTASGDQAFCKFGSAVASAGDVNRDGYDDVLVSAPFHGGTHYVGEGRVYLFLGGPSGPSTSPDWMAEGGQYSAEMGFGLASAGDVNGDGYDDVIVGAHGYQGAAGEWEGEAMVFLGGPAGLSPTPVWTVTGGLADSNFGMAVASAGDVNHDGYDDVLVGAPCYGDPQGGPLSGGRAFFYLGSPSGPLTTPAWQAGPGQRYASYGGVQGAGDLNGDGYDDIMVGAPKFDSNGRGDEGRVFVYFGYATGPSAAPSQVLRTGEGGAWFGYSLGRAGDVNHDGYSDVIVGAPLGRFNLTHEGWAIVVMGSPAGLETDEGWYEHGCQAECYYGGGVSSAGDINGDGFADILVGAPGYDDGEVDEGRACVYCGPGLGDPTSSAPAAPSHLAGPERLKCPNPLCAGDEIIYTLERPARADLEVWDLSGRLVTRLATVGSPGTHSVIWPATDDAGREIPRGVYFVRFTSDRSSIARRFVLLGRRR
jgi:hypothetical protein